MLAADVRYRLAHHADLTWGPQLDVAEAEPGTSSTTARADPGGRDRPPPGRADARLPVEAGGRPWWWPVTPCRALRWTGSVPAPTSTSRRCCVRTSSAWCRRGASPTRSTTTRPWSRQRRRRHGHGWARLVLTHQVPTPAAGVRQRVDRPGPAPLRRGGRLRRGPGRDHRRRPVTPASGGKSPSARRYWPRASAASLISMRRSRMASMASRTSVQRSRSLRVTAVPRPVRRRHGPSGAGCRKGPRPPARPGSRPVPA